MFSIITCHLQWKKIEKQAGNQQAFVSVVFEKQEWLGIVNV